MCTIYKIIYVRHSQVKGLKQCAIMSSIIDLVVGILYISVGLLGLCTMWYRTI